MCKLAHKRPWTMLCGCALILLLLTTLATLNGFLDFSADGNHSWTIASS